MADPTLFDFSFVEHFFGADTELCDGAFHLHSVLMKILGISCFFHDSSAVLIEDGMILAAAEEERFTRKKHDSRFPHAAIAYCLEEARKTNSEVDWIVFYEKPFLKFDRLIETWMASAPSGLEGFTQGLSSWMKDKIFTKNNLVKELKKHGFSSRVAEKLLFAEHHQSHAGSAFYPSPFSESAILTVDGVGEWVTTSISHGQFNQVKRLEEIHFPHSLGLLYSAFTAYTGFKVNSGEYKMMGLAPYGEPRYQKQILDHLLDLKADGSFRLNLDYFNYTSGLTMTNERFHHLFGGPPRLATSLITQKEMDLACSIQKVCEEALLRLARRALHLTGSKNLCLAGGVALNCVANGKILKELSLQGLWIQPAAGDSGGALGAALSAYHEFLQSPRKTQPDDSMKGSYLGPEYSDDEIERFLVESGAKFEILSDEDLMNRAVRALKAEKALGWFQGRMEFGPRALGNRSILADARSPRMQEMLNLKVKNRESFRPFAPSILREHLSEWFELETDSPYMLLVADIQKLKRLPGVSGVDSIKDFDLLKTIRSEIPAVTHVDFSARIQTVDRRTNPKYHALLSHFFEETGCPCLVNTSFNVRGEPIVCTPSDALKCFMSTQIDALALGNFWLEKEGQTTRVSPDFFELD